MIIDYDQWPTLVRVNLHSGGSTALREPRTRVVLAQVAWSEVNLPKKSDVILKEKGEGEGYTPNLNKIRQKGLPKTDVS